jgi:hypothetical protein
MDGLIVVVAVEMIPGRITKSLVITAYARRSLMTVNQDKNLGYRLRGIEELVSTH